MCILTGMDMPHLTIIIEPKEFFRFRYESEKGSHGGLGGVGPGKNHPTVKLEDYHSTRKVNIVASLYTADDTPSEHVINLFGENCVDGKCSIPLDDSMTVVFPDLQFSMKKKDEVLDILAKRYHKKPYVKLSKVLQNVLSKKRKAINMHSAKLSFEAVYEDNSQPVCERVYSHEISNAKESNDLRIVRLSKFTAIANSEEEIILLCNKIRKDDIEIHFYVIENNQCSKNIIGKGSFNPVDVHYQFAITFKVPQCCSDLEDDQMVKIALYRPSDDKYGDARDFKFIPDEYSAKKRKRPNPSMESTPISFDFTNFDMDIFFGEHGTSLPYVDDLQELNTLLEQRMPPSALSELNCDAAKIEPDIANPETLHQNKSELFLKQIDILKNIDEKAINQLDNSKKTLLHRIVSKNESQICKLFLNRGGDPYAKDGKGENCFHIAARYNCHQAMEALLNHSKNDATFSYEVEQLNHEGYTPLHLCILNDSKDCLNYLILAGASINTAEGRSGRTPLHLAIEHKPSLVHFISAQPFVDVLLPDFGGLTPLHLASEMKNFSYDEAVSEIEEGTADFFQNSLEYLNQMYKSEAESIPLKELDVEGMSHSLKRLEMDIPVEPKDISPAVEKSCVLKDSFCDIIDNEERLCQVLDSNEENWRTIALYNGLSEKQIDSIANDYKRSSPSRAVLQNIKETNGVHYVQKLKDIIFIAKDVIPSLKDACPIIESF